MKRILLVEDEPTIAAGVRDDLQMEGYAVDLATDGVDAAERGGRGSYDLILLDLMLPKKDGLTVCRELRAAGILTPIIMLTARGQEADKVLGLEFGADDYVTKPFGRRELQSRVKAALRRGAIGTNTPQPPDTFSFADLQIDFRRCEVRKKGKPVELTALEFKLLRAFLMRRGEVLTIDQLNESVWGKDVFITDRVVYTHMNNLRKKIEVNAQSPRHLITIRGTGYRFDA